MMENQFTADRLVKDSLRLSIISKRHARGESDIKVEFTENTQHELTEEELSRRERRRAQNREAARRCRIKKRLNKSGSLKDFRTYSTKNIKLQSEIKQLTEEKCKLENIVENHVNTSDCMYNHYPHNQHCQAATTTTTDVVAASPLVTRQFSIPSDSFTDLEKLLTEANPSTFLPFGNYSIQPELASSDQCVTPISAGFQVLSANQTQENVTFFGDDFMPDKTEMKLCQVIKTENVVESDSDETCNQCDDHGSSEGIGTNLSLPDFGQLLFESNDILNPNYIKAYLNN